MPRMNRLQQLRVELKEVSEKQQTLASRADDIRGEIKPLVDAEHRRRIRGALGAYVTANFIGGDTPKYGDHVTIIRCARKYVTVQTEKHGRWQLNYWHLSVDEPSGSTTRINRAISGVMEGRV